MPVLFFKLQEASLKFVIGYEPEDVMSLQRNDRKVEGFFIWGGGGGGGMRKKWGGMEQECVWGEGRGRICLEDSRLSATGNEM